MTTTSPTRSRRGVRPRPLALAIGALAAAAAAVTLTLYSRVEAAAESTPDAPPPPKVTVATVQQELVTDFEELTGHVDATETVELRARVSGHIDKVHFQAGQLVQKNDVLLSIDPRWYRAQFDLAQARADVAVREATRAEKLLEASAISSEEAEARRAAAAEARAALETARLDLEFTQVRAPIAGRVSRAFVTAGNLVSGSPGNATLLTTIVSVGDAYVYADLDESTLLKFNRLAREGRILTEGGRIPVDLQLADESDFPRHGYVEAVDNRVNPATGSLALRLIFPNDDGALLPGLFARVRLPVSAPQPALLVSERAIGTDQSQKFVLAVNSDNTVAYRTVTLGSVVDDRRVVSSGLQVGDTIIVNGLQRVRPGMAVSPEPQDVASTPARSQAPGGTHVALN